MTWRHVVRRGSVAAAAAAPAMQADQLFNRTVATYRSLPCILHSTPGVGL